MVIRAAHYDELERKLTQDPIVIGMAEGVRGIRDTIGEPDGTPTFDFMLAANREFDKRGGDKTLPLHIGAVARAILMILDGEQPSQDGATD